MLNRHAIVLFLGVAALMLLREAAPFSAVLLGGAFVALVLGLMLDDGQGGARAALAHLIQAIGVALLASDAAGVAIASGGAAHLVLAEAGIAAAVLGLLAELWGSFGVLRASIAVQGGGDLLYLGGLALGLTQRTRNPSAIGWIFIAIAGGLAAYAAGYNLLLQGRRLRDLRAGWRFHLVGIDDRGLLLHSPSGAIRVDFKHIEAVQRLDRRHLIFILPSPLPAELGQAGLPLEELRQGAEPLVAEEPPPERYALLLHEQELGRPVTEAEEQIRPRLAVTSA